MIYHTKPIITLEVSIYLFNEVYNMILHKTSIELREELIGACGIYCGWCPYYIIGTKEFKCGGCWTREKCEIRDCAASKGMMQFPAYRSFKVSVGSGISLWVLVLGILVLGCMLKWYACLTQVPWLLLLLAYSYMPGLRRMVLAHTLML